MKQIDQLPSEMDARNTKRSRATMSKVSQSFDHSNLLKSKRKIRDSTQSSQLLGKPWMDVAETDSSWLALRKDLEYLKSKRLDHLSREQLQEIGEQPQQQSPRTYQSFNKGQKIYSSRQLSTSINLDANKKSTFHK